MRYILGAIWSSTTSFCCFTNSSVLTHLLIKSIGLFYRVWWCKFTVHAWTFMWDKFGLVEILVTKRCLLQHLLCSTHNRCLLHQLLLVRQTLSIKHSCGRILSCCGELPVYHSKKLLREQRSRRWDHRHLLLWRGNYCCGSRRESTHYICNTSFNWSFLHCFFHRIIILSGVKGQQTANYIM